MGQAGSGLQPELDMQPGAYRIVSALTGTVIQVSDHDHSKVVAWEKHDRKNQQVSKPDGLLNRSRLTAAATVVRPKLWGRIQVQELPTWELLGCRKHRYPFLGLC
jgi:hypothetical protein